MKNKKYLSWGTLIMGMALVSGLMGCATTDGGGTPPTPDEQAAPDKQTEGAAKLAADLNAIQAGSAAAEGATVTLSGVLRLTVGFDVPAGVTLDLTADGAKFELRDGTVLTVDGTVNTSGHDDRGSGWVEGGLRIGDGAAVINGSGTIRHQSKGFLLDIWSDQRQLTFDGVTLIGLEDNDRSLVHVGGGGVEADVGSVFTMTGGTITGNALSGGEDSTNGGGVSVQQEVSVFTIEGGTIYGASEGANANTAQEGAVLRVGNVGMAKWGTGGAYTKGGVPQTGGGDIGASDDTLIAIPAQ
ncbi:MAG: hypothetical protein LBG27_08680 [Spirochaetaceae bacterium]|jgi:hypothetical protein|nr:hypothetical protein [Spirochaetaceae bacterium]